MLHSRANRIKTRRSDRALLIVFYIVSGAFALLCLYPFVQVVVSSFTEESSLLRNGYTLFPEVWSTAAYRVVLSSRAIYTSYGVTLFITVVGTAIQVLITAMAAYAIAGNRIKYANAINFFFYFTMLFNGGLVAGYILIKDFLHLDNTIWVYIVPNMFNAYNCFLLRNFFNDIPPSLIESAKLDGAREVTIMLRIVFPLSLPAFATIALFTAVGFWNEWSMGMLYVTDDKLYTLQYRIVRLIQSVDEANRLAGQGNAGTSGAVPATTVRLATAIITIGPIILLYPFLQKYFVAGLKIGGVKG